MNVRSFLKNFLYLLKKSRKSLLLLLIIPLLYIVYSKTILDPYEDKYHLLSFAFSPIKKGILGYILLTYPVFFAFVYFAINWCKKIQILKCIFYPYTFIAIFCQSMPCIMIIRTDFYGFYVILFPFWFALTVILAIIGLIQDIKIFKNTEIPKEI